MKRLRFTSSFNSLRQPEPRGRAFGARAVSRGVALGLVAACFAAHNATPAAAQQNQPSFSLPEPTPTPTVAPQGPADERAGVQIAPRVIPRDAPRAAPSPAATPSPAYTPPPRRLFPPEPSPPVDTAPPPQAETQSADTISSEPESPALTAGSGQSAPQPQSTAGTSNTPLPDAPLPSDMSDTASGEDFLIGEDEWIDVAPAQTGEEEVRPFIDLGPIRKDAGTAARQPAFSSWWWAAVAFGLLLLALMVWRTVQMRRTSPLMIEKDVTTGVRVSISNSYDRGVTGPAPSPGKAQPSSRPAKREAVATPPAQRSQPAAPAQPRRDTPLTPPAPAFGFGEGVSRHNGSAEPATPPLAQAEPQPTPQPLSLSLAIASASRSVMMFTVEFRLTLANRSDVAVRDIAVSAQLTSAQKGKVNAASLTAAQPLETIERIGPQQSRTVSGTLQLPMREVRALRQGEKPLFIPLLHVTLDGAGQRADATSFVIGTPSQTNQLRLHPIALDTPVGSIPGLRANAIRTFEAREPA